MEQMDRRDAGKPSTDAVRDSYLQLFALAMQPSPAWCGRGFDLREAAAEGRTRATAVYFSSDIYSRIALPLAQHVYPSQDAVAEAIKTAWANIPAADLVKALDAAFARAQGRFQADWAGATKGVGFRLGGDTFSFEASGNSASGATGRIWGDGWIQGQQVALEVESSSAATMSREQRDETKGSVGASQKTGADVGIK
jgi:hypothetical protein